MTNKSIAETAANNFLVIEGFSIKKVSDIVSAPKHVVERAIKDGIISKRDKFEYSMLDPADEAVFLEVKSAFDKTRTYLNRKTTPCRTGKQSSQSNKKLFPIGMYSDLYGNLQNLRDEAYQLRDAMVGDDGSRWEAIVRRGKIHIARKWGDRAMQAIDYPTASEFKSRCTIVIPDPTILQAADIRSFGGDLLRVAENHNKALVEQFENAKTDSIENALKFTRKVVTQLTKLDDVKSSVKPRLYDSLLDNLKDATSMLKALNTSLGDDPSITSAITTIEGRVTNVENKDVWKDSPSARSSAIRGATDAVKTLEKMTKKTEVEKIDLSKGKPKIGGLFGKALNS